ncbi:MAG: hypothetical protein ACR2KZ_06070 [Segetibacter sp.]
MGTNAGGGAGCLAWLTGTTNQVIVLSVLGVVVMYIISLISLFVLRIKERDLERPFTAPFYPWFPVKALVLCLVSLAAIIWYDVQLSILFFSMLLLMLSAYIFQENIE